MNMNVIDCHQHPGAGSFLTYVRDVTRVSLCLANSYESGPQRERSAGGELSRLYLVITEFACRKIGFVRCQIFDKPGKRRGRRSVILQYFYQSAGVAYAALCPRVGLFVAEMCCRYRAPASDVFDGIPGELVHATLFFIPSFEKIVDYPKKPDKCESNSPTEGSVEIWSGGHQCLDVQLGRATAESFFLSGHRFREQCGLSVPASYLLTSCSSWSRSSEDILPSDFVSERNPEYGSFLSCPLEPKLLMSKT
ncbi:hypothetical protein EVAR_101927_1 [Eumeta japonica]|uniref:Uncharacterized protein n=1 Tax=Eumeta variegata TaxID=151549 RepID=A0A4C1TSB6_EUMVA|nr:hypothetical protein EVAR_101927_1 [Eumeta japonica]